MCSSLARPPLPCKPRFGTAQARTITTEWHPTFNLPTRIVELGKTTVLDYDTQEHLRTRTETAASGAARVWTYTYNAIGQVRTVDGPRTGVADLTAYDHDPTSGNLLSIANAVGYTTQITAHDPDGRPLALLDPNGVIPTLQYDARGRLISRMTGGETTDFDYDPAGNLERVTLPDGSFLDYGYDGAHRLTDIADNLGNHLHSGI